VFVCVYVCLCINVDRKLEINNARVYIILRLPTTAAVAAASASPIRLGRYLFVLFFFMGISNSISLFIFL